MIAVNLEHSTVEKWGSFAPLSAMVELGEMPPVP
jgi:hypothetical protein